MNGQLIGHSSSITASKTTISPLSKSDSFIILLNPGSGGSNFQGPDRVAANFQWRQGACCPTHYQFPILPQTDPRVHRASLHHTLDQFQDQWLQLRRHDRTATFLYRPQE